MAGLRLGIATAQVAPAPLPSGVNLIGEANAERTRQQLSELLKQYPPTVTRVLQTDPGLLTNKEYLAPYPGLASFVTKHPEILHNASYFLGVPTPTPNPNINRPGPVRYERNSNTFRDVAQYISVGLVLMTVAFGITWIVRSLVDYRKWTRMTRIQTDFHSRLMDRLTSSEDLLAYLQSPAGKRFLEFAPPSAGNVSSGSTPGRILRSVQAGLVIGLSGVGLTYASEHIALEAAQPFFVLGVLGIAVGTGFVLSAFASYVIARNMGLVQGTSETPPT